jgi:hypothetical protein
LNGAIAKILVICNTPNDAASFDCYHCAGRIPIAKKLPDLLS